MKSLHRISLAFIAVPLLAMLPESLSLIRFVQPERREILAGHMNFMFSYENWVHEAGFARLVLSFVGLLILFIPYRKGERWALAALCVLIFGYGIPVFVFGAIPNLGTWPFLRNLPETPVVSLAVFSFEAYLYAFLSVGGLILAAPRFLMRTKP